jgi:LAS superfamily LD-carboxypeptidase LdcB
MLNSLELTGRSDAHVRPLPGLGCTLEDRTAVAAQTLIAAAHAEGIDLVIVSSFRDFDRQVGIWNGKFRGERPLLARDGSPMDAGTLDDDGKIDAILLWSALPGASRHHWGTDVDVIDRAAVPASYQPQLTQAEFAPTGPFARLNQWMGQNLARFGFFRPYSVDRGGVQPEPWHLSYAPVASQALARLSLEVLAEAISGSAMLGRERVLTRLPDLYERYVRAIDSPPVGGRGVNDLTRPS